MAFIDDAGVIGGTKTSSRFTDDAGILGQPYPRFVDDAGILGVEGVYSGEMPVIDPSEPTAPPKDFTDYGRVIGESAYKTTMGAMAFPLKFGAGIGAAIRSGLEESDVESGVITALGKTGEHLGENLVGMAEFTGRPLGLYGKEAFKESWSTDPFGSAMGAAGPVGALGRYRVSRLRAKSVPTPETFVDPLANDPSGIIESPYRSSLPVRRGIPEDLSADPYVGEKPYTSRMNEEAYRRGPESHYSDEFTRQYSPDAKRPYEGDLAIVNKSTGKPPVDYEQATEQYGRGVYENIRRGYLGEEIPDPPTPPGETPSAPPPPPPGVKWTVKKAEAPKPPKGISERPTLLSDLENQKNYLKYLNDILVKWETSHEYLEGAATKKEYVDAKRVAEQEIKKLEDKLKQGPGAQTPGLIKETPSDLEQLTQAVISNADPNRPLIERLQVGEAIVGPVNNARDSVSSALNNLKSITAVLTDAISRPREFVKDTFAPKESQYKTILGDYLFARTKTGIEASRFAKAINKSFSPERQEAMRKWYLANGDTNLLKAWAESIEDPRLKKMYTDALKLTPEEQTIASNIRNYHEAKLQEAVDAGILEHGVENYIRRIWKKDNEATKVFLNELNSGMLRKNPSLLRKRLYETEFQAEQTGKRLKDYRIGHSVTAYDIDFNEALAARAFIAQGLEATALDGRPLFAPSGAMRILKDAEGGKKYIIKTKARPEETGDYRYVDHPSLRKWKLAGYAGTDKAIIYEADILVHPEAYKHLRSVLGKSRVSEHAIGGPVLKLSQEFKNTLLSMSGFHQVQIGVHSIFHKVNPFRAPEIDLNVPDQASLVRRGLQVHSHRALAEFGEGLYSSGITNKLPGLGPLSQKYGSYLFESYIPRQKMQMALAALERNRVRYKGKLTDTQIVELTSEQANAAFGELNYKWMGRSPTMQDAFRLMLLAPDFLEARGRFVGQAAKPYGREQAAALIRGALGMYAAARIFNQALDGDPHWDQPFGVVYNNKEYSLRSIPGDLQHLFSDARSFAYHRLNPMVARTAVEFVTGRDAFGRERSAFQQIGDFFTNSVPIPMQGLVSGRERTLWQSLLSSIGISSWKDTSNAARLARKLHSSNIPKGILTEEQEHRLSTKYKVTELFREGKRQEAIELAKKEGLDNKDLIKANEDSRTPEIVIYYRNLNPTQAIEVWDSADDKEKRLIANMFYSKLLSDRHLDNKKKVKYFREIKGLRR